MLKCFFIPAGFSCIVLLRPDLATLARKEQCCHYDCVIYHINSTLLSVAVLLVTIRPSSLKHALMKRKHWPKLHFAHLFLRATGVNLAFNLLNRILWKKNGPSFSRCQVLLLRAFVWPYLWEDKTILRLDCSQMCLSCLRLLHIRKHVFTDAPVLLFLDLVGMKGFNSCRSSDAQSENHLFLSYQSSMCRKRLCAFV